MSQCDWAGAWLTSIRAGPEPGRCRLLSGVRGVREYDLITEWYASERVDQTGVPEVAALASSIPHGARVLDIGCGNGIPITHTLLRAGHLVIGFDSSGAMLQRFRVNCPETPAVRGVVQACPFADRIFDAAVAWGVMFHLSPEHQIKAIASVSRVLKTGAPFLFTSGDMDDPDGKEGTMNGVVFRYFSFSIETCRRILDDQGFTLIDIHEDSAGNTCYLAIRSCETCG
jgi:SAM-dependent methyltransferase